jgi:mannosyl-oligosaccharide alpha-1,2-mannosidase
MPHTERQRAVVDAIKHAWSGYKKYAWGHDDLLPLSKSHSSNDYGMAMTMVDSLDTLWLAGMQEEFDEAREWIAENLRFDTNRHKVIVFEVNIRVVGGLLSAYHLSQDKMFLKKAVSMCVCVCVCVCERER